jgi:O-succinylbenzoic acid--CoA ligase
VNSIKCPVAAAAASSPNLTACVLPDRTISFAQLDNLVTAMSRDLLEWGIKPGARFAMLLPNSLTAAALIFAAARIGASIVPLNLKLLPGDWQEMCAEAECVLVCTNSEHLHRLDESHPPSLVIDEPQLERSSHPGIHDEFIMTNLDVDLEATLIFTSGSTGHPKGVALTNGNYYYNAAGSNVNIRLDHGDCWFLSLPLCHVGGVSILHRAFQAGVAVQIAERFDPDEINKLLDLGGITHVSLVPVMLKLLLEARQGRPLPTTLRTILLGGAAAPLDLVEDIRRLNLPVLTTYGMTEATSQVTTMSPFDSYGKLSTSGRALEYCQVKIVADDGQALPPNEVGRIAVAGQILYKGYVTGRGEVEPRRDEWFQSGDLGMLDEDGYLTVKGRADEMIISGGENIYPQEIMQAADAYAKISSSAVIVIPDKTWGQRPVLYVETVDAGSFNEVEFRDWLSRHIARFKMPEQIIAVEQLPRTALGKIDREELQRDFRSRFPDTSS